MIDSSVVPAAISAAVLGFLLGLRHATDADHVVAVTTIVARERTLARAARVGALWGVGHSLTLFVVGGAIVLFRLVIPPRIGLGLEFGVALMLILLGFDNLRGKASEHSHGADVTAAGIRPLVIGVVHGLAGSAAIALLVLATIRDTGWALAYLAVFGIGTIAGMMIVTTLLAAPALYATTRVVRFQRGIRLAAGALSLIFGAVLAHEIIVTNGLFSTTPSWTPR
jgi:high-affinity nickel-transport protein